MVLRAHIKKLGTVLHTYSPGAVSKEWRWTDPCCFLATSLVYSVSSRAVRDPVCKNKVETPEEDTQVLFWPTHILVPTHMHTYS